MGSFAWSVNLPGFIQSLPERIFLFDLGYLNPTPSRRGKSKLLREFTHLFQAPISDTDLWPWVGVYRSFCNFPLRGNFSGYRGLG